MRSVLYALALVSMMVMGLHLAGLTGSSQEELAVNPCNPEIQKCT